MRGKTACFCPINIIIEIDFRLDVIKGDMKGTPLRIKLCILKGDVNGMIDFILSLPLERVGALNFHKSECY
jgi:hypothetical protein